MMSRVASKLLMAFSAGIVFLLGAIHLTYTFTGTRLLPRDPALQAAKSQAPLSITKETNVLRAWIGFNASHSLALLFFALVFGYLAFAHTDFLFGSTYLLATGFLVLAGFAVLAKLYWFNIPFAGVTTALVSYLASIVAARF